MKVGRALSGLQLYKMGGGALMAECGAGKNPGYTKKNQVLLSLVHVPPPIGQTLL